MAHAKQLGDTIQQILDTVSYTTPQEATAAQLHQSVATTVIAGAMDRWQAAEEKKMKGRRASYLSAEFLMGRLVYNNLLCLGVLEEVDQELERLGTSLDKLEEIEDAALGNGGLGRLAACFLDSAVTVGVPLDGYGIRYKYGIFKQNIVDGFQEEEADDWTRHGDPWSIRREDEAVHINFSDQTVNAVPYDMPIFGYGAEDVGTLRLWQAEPLTPFDFQLFNDQEYDASVEDKNRAEDISRVLYPNDDQESGKVLRLKQQYFFSSASMQDLLRKFEEVHGTDYSQFPKYHTVQLNDTHPAIAIPEFIRILVQEKNVPFEKASQLAKEVFNYTNHTIMAEALESWDVGMLEQYLPKVMEILRQMDDALVEDLTDKGVAEDTLETLRLIQDGRVHMAQVSVYYSGKINGVAELHSQIIKDTLFHDWYTIYPERFTNMTNGVTQRRWLALCNPELSALYTRLLDSDAWMTDLSQLKGLEKYADDEEVLKEFLAIKKLKRQQLTDFLQREKGIIINPDTIFDTQIKRLHEYKRQFLNILTILALYFEIKDGKLTDFTPTTFLFGAKSAPGYYRAKGIIKLINEVSDFISKDPEVSQLIQVVFVPNYNVTCAEYMIAASDVSEQISTAGTEASGTGNMKFMMNGAVTLGTYDGANVEIVAEAGREHNYIFGAEVEELNEIRATYDPREIYNSNPLIKRVLDTLVDGTLDDGGSGIFEELYNTLLQPTGWSEADQYFLLYDFMDYLETRKQVNQDYKDSMEFAKKCWINLSNSGKFSSDRTISQYGEEIWKV